MKRQELFDQLKQIYGTEPDYPWNDWSAVLRHKDNNKRNAMHIAETVDKLVKKYGTRDPYELCQCPGISCKYQKIDSAVSNLHHLIPPNSKFLNLRNTVSQI